MIIYPIFPFGYKCNRSTSVDKVCAIFSYQQQVFVKKIFINFINYSRCPVVIVHLFKSLPLGNRQWDPLAIPIYH